MKVLITGRPKAIASKNTTGSPSAKLGITSARAAQKLLENAVFTQVTSNPHHSCADPTGRSAVRSRSALDHRPQ